MLTSDKYFFISLISLLSVSLVYFSNLNEKKKLNIYFSLFLITLAAFILWSIFLTFSQYFIWKQNSISKYLLPPYQKINYFLNYSFFHFFRDLLFRLLGILFVFSLIFLLNFIFKRDLFYDDEKILIPYFSLLFVFPYNMFLPLIGFGLLLGLILVKNLSLFFKIKNQRFSFRNYWLYIVWLALFLQPFILSNYQFAKYIP